MYSTCCCLKLLECIVYCVIFLDFHVPAHCKHGSEVQSFQLEDGVNLNHQLFPPNWKLCMKCSSFHPHFKIKYQKIPSNTTTYSSSPHVFFSKFHLFRNVFLSLVLVFGHFGSLTIPSLPLCHHGRISPPSNASGGLVNLHPPNEPPPWGPTPY